MQLSFALFVLLLIFPGVFQEKPLPDYPGGKYINSQGTKFFLDCYGSGSPTVLLWSGQGGGFLDWLLVQPEIAKTNRVCSFDAPGFGRSDNTPDSDTFEGTVHSLTQALSSAGEHGPFVVVGQSYGGVEARLFQYKHPELVRGMVLVDSYEIAAPWKGQMVPLYTLSAEQLRSTLPDHSHAPPPTAPQEIEAPYKVLPAAAQAEHLRDVQSMVKALDFKKEPAVMESYRSTLLILHDASLPPDSLHGLPLFIITRDGVTPPEEAIQQGYLKLSSRSHRTVAKGSGHFVQLDHPEIIVSAIHEAVAESRK